MKIPPWTTMTIGARLQFAVKVDCRDLEFLLRWRWTYARSHGR
jgi:hypothetical protein